MKLNTSVSCFVRPRAFLAALMFFESQILFAPLARAFETLRVGKSVPQAFSFVPLDIGMKNGIFKKNGVEIEPSAFSGDAKMQQAMAADSLDIGIGSGPAMAFIVKGSPIKAVADLKGKKVAVSTVGSLTYWLTDELSRRQGWGPGGIIIAPIGAFKPMLAALKTKQMDGIVTDV